MRIVHNRKMILGRSQTLTASAHTHTYISIRIQSTKYTHQLPSTDQSHFIQTLFIILNRGIWTILGLCVVLHRRTKGVNGSMEMISMFLEFEEHSIEFVYHFVWPIPLSLSTRMNSIGFSFHFATNQCQSHMSIRGELIPEKIDESISLNRLRCKEFLWLLSALGNSGIQNSI